MKTCQRASKERKQTEPKPVCVCVGTDESLQLQAASVNRLYPHLHLLTARIHPWPVGLCWPGRRAYNCPKSNPLANQCLPTCLEYASDPNRVRVTVVFWYEADIERCASQTLGEVKVEPCRDDGGRGECACECGKR